MAGYNPNTYPYYQCDEEDYNSGEPPDEQDEQYTFACGECGWRKTLDVDDLAAYYERPVAPCGCLWDLVECVG